MYKEVQVQIQDTQEEAVAAEVAVEATVEVVEVEASTEEHQVHIQVQTLRQILRHPQ